MGQNPRYLAGLILLPKICSRKIVVLTVIEKKIDDKIKIFPEKDTRCATIPIVISPIIRYATSYAQRLYSPVVKGLIRNF